MTRFQSILLQWILPVMLAAALGAGLWMSAWVDQSRLPSPSGEHEAIIQARRFHSFLPAMPGQGGDKPGRLVVIGPSGKRCGSIDLPMINMAYDAQWTPEEVHIRVLGRVLLCA